MTAATISLSLPTSTIYVSGTINGVASAWLNVYGGIWESKAERSENDVYEVELTLIGSTGITKTANFVLYLGVLNLIFDRTKNDVDYAKRITNKIKSGKATEEETSKWLSGLKGAYNALDLNRVENAISFLSNQLRELPKDIKEHAKVVGVYWEEIYNVPYDPELYYYSTKIDWALTDFFDYDNQKRYLGNIKHIVTSFSYESDDVPDSFDEFDFNSANNAEKILFRLNEDIESMRKEKKRLIDNTKSAWYQSGEIFGGELI